ncbi:hypothetical protein TNCV_2805741 [Trichonephila clavipes]|nr:hypothetical protein TNCV_2805741 [Trichonephila clavipes]
MIFDPPKKSLPRIHGYSKSANTWNNQGSGTVFWRLEVQAKDQDKIVDGPQRPMKIVILVLTARRHRNMNATLLQQHLRSATGTTVSTQTVRNWLHGVGLYAHRSMKLVLASEETEFAVGDIERLFEEARRNTETKHIKNGRNVTIDVGVMCKLRPRIGKRKESGPTKERKTQQGGPVRSRKGRERNNSSNIEERIRSSKKNARRGGIQRFPPRQSDR